MLRLFGATLVFLLSAGVAHAHHIWILPGDAGRPARAVFGDTLEPGSPRVLEHIGQTRLWLLDARGRESPLGWQRTDDSYAIDVPRDAQALGGVCVYGTEVHDHRLRQDVAPYLLVYYPKALLTGDPAGKSWPKLTLEIVPAFSGDAARLQVLFKGRPAPRAEMVVFGPDDRSNLTTNEQGQIEINLKPGLYGLRTRVLEDQGGSHEGKKYEQIRHYASLVFRFDARPARP